MRKYLAVAKIMFKAQIIYRFDVMFTAIGTVWRVLFAWVVWGAIFAGHETVGGFTFQAMLSYYVVSSFLASADKSGSVLGEVSERIRGGTFSKLMVIPAKPQLYFLSQTFGASGYYALFSIIASIVCIFIFHIKLAFTADPAVIICAIVMIPVSLTFMAGYQFFIGILAFKFQDISFFTHVQNALLSFLTGAMIPLALLPRVVTNILRFVPFTYVTYMPSMLLTGQIGIWDGVFGLVVLLVWTTGILIIGQLTYNRLRVKFDGVGI